MGIFVLLKLYRDDFSPTLNFRSDAHLKFERIKVQKELLKSYLK
ncbi:hypothetical protein [Maribacter algicola]|nr:hypothetical protein [Maribacter algicola]